MADVGRPTKFTEETRKKIEEATALDASIEEVCYYADISKDTYYRWLKENPEFSDRLDTLRQRPILKARKTIDDALGDPSFAFRYLEKKRRKEFGNNLDITSDNERLTINLVQYDGDNRAV